MNYDLGVAITTHNRRSTFLEAVAHWRKHLPDDAVLVVVDDGSTEPVSDIPGATVIRHPYAKGIAMAKNRCIAELMDAGCNHLFLVDDDCYPVADDWWKPYLESPEHHLQYGWPNKGTRGANATGWPPRIEYADEQHAAYTFPRGVLQYATRQAIEAAGGMDTAHGAHGGEHVDWSRRIHATGLTTHAYMDVSGSNELFYSVDQREGNATGSSRFTLRERRRLCGANGARWGYQGTGYPFFPYREGAAVRDWSLGPRLSDIYEGALDHILGLHPFGTACEFGVGQGNSLRRIASHMPVYGFDVFTGLPEDWEVGRFEKGHFACPPPEVDNTTLIEGLFADTLPSFNFSALSPVGLWHLDADLHSSTATILDHIEPHLLPGAYVVFDEYHGAKRCIDHEQRAWREFAERSDIGWTVVGHGPEQWAVRIL